MQVISEAQTCLGQWYICNQILLFSKKMMGIVCYSIVSPWFYQQMIPFNIDKSLSRPTFSFFNGS